MRTSCDEQDCSIGPAAARARISVRPIRPAQARARAAADRRADSARRRRRAAHARARVPARRRPPARRRRARPARRPRRRRASGPRSAQGAGALGVRAEARGAAGVPPLPRSPRAAAPMSTAVAQSVIRALAVVSRRGDLAVAAILLVAVTMIIVPLPTGLVDVLITTNMAMSALVLLVAFYAARPTELSALPSIILVATLFRLAITISTSRLILLQGDAGEIVTAFGDFVIGGNIAVGLTIFLIITIAQFVVITKGAERVAEVAARFSLDSLPGKQMSIDADLRSGDIDQAEARALRAGLQRESQLYGAMDGAMKFVKGDAIASIVVVLVNLIGGLAIGTIQQGKPIGAAAELYSLLTVGDGLVAQIPALLMSVAAGALVTRVVSEDGHDLGTDIAGQLFRDPRVLAIAATVLLGLAAVPGFPSPVFLILAAIFGAVAFVLRRLQSPAQPAAERAAPSQAKAPEAAPAISSDNGALLDDQSSVVLVRLGSTLAGAIAPAALRERADGVRWDIYEDLGVELPAVGCRV